MIKKTLWNLVCHLLAWYGLLIRPWTIKRFRESGGILVIMAHDPEKKTLKNTLRWFKKKGFAFISADDVVNHLEEGVPLPTPSVWLTFDDGWKRNTEIFPWLEQQQIPATVFLATNAIELGYFWFDITRRRCNAAFLQIGRFEYEKQPDATRKKLIQELISNPNVYVPRNTMTVSDVATWSGRGISFENHTADHVILPQCSPDEVREEIMRAEQKIQEWTVRKSKLLSYPIGHCNSIDTNILADCGILAAVTTESSWWIPANTNSEQQYFIPRTEFPNYGPTGYAIASTLGITAHILCSLRNLRARLYRKNG